MTTQISIEQRPFGATQQNISALGFGAWAIGGLGYGDQNEDDAMAAIAAYLEAGGRFFDTSRGYGISEILLGKGLQAFADRDDVFVTSKSGSTHPPCMRTDLETSLFCLQRPVVDCYLIHVPPEDPDHLKRLLDTYQEAKEKGKTRYIGISCRRLNDPAGLEAALSYLDDPRVDMLEAGYSYVETGSEALIDAAHAKGVGIIARSNMAGGLLTGRYRPGHKFEDPSNNGRAGIAQDKLDAMLAVVEDIERQLLRPPYTNMAELALSFALSRPGVTTIIPGARSAEQVHANLSVAKLPPMPADLAAQLKEAGKAFSDIRHAK